MDVAFGIYKSIPPITRAIGTMVIGVSFLIYLNIITQRSVYFIPSLIWRKS